MDAKVERMENGEACLEITVSAEKFEEGMNQAYHKVVKQVNVPGFRKGKVPRPILENFYGREVLYQDALEYIIPTAYDKALEELALDVLSQPEFDFDIEKIEKDKPFVFQANVAVKPEVTLGELEGLEINIPDFSVTDDVVESRLQEMQKNYAKIVDKTDGTAENGDILYLDFEGFVDGEAFEGGKADDYYLELGSNTFIPGFEEQLAGLKIGEEKDVNVTFPEEYQAEHLAGKPAVFKVKVNKIQTKELRELNDEFAQEVSEFETIGEYKEDVRNNLVKMMEVQKKEATRQEAVSKALEGCEIVLSDKAIAAQAQVVAGQFEQRLAAQGLPMGQYLEMTNSSVEQIIEAMKPEAERQLKRELMLEKIIAEKGIEPSDEEVDKYIEDMASDMGIELEEFKKNVAGMMDKIHEEVKMQKAIDYLTDNANITVASTKEEDAEAETEE